MSKLSDVRQMTNAQLKKIIQKIEVDKEGNVEIYLRLFGELGLDETVLIDSGMDDVCGEDAKSNGNSMDENTVRICDNHT